MGNILWLHEIDRMSTDSAGGKGASLGEMVRAGLPVPTGFVVTAGAYRSHVRDNGLPARIARCLEDLDYTSPQAVEQASREIGAWIAEAGMPVPLAAEITRAYRELAAKAPSPLVAVRSSATAEDLPDASFAGQQQTFLNVQGEEAVLEAVRRCWASLWGSRALAYRTHMGYDHLSVHLAVVVQAMVPAETAGVMFTANPLSGSASEFLVTASYGLGEAVVGGLVTPDTFVLDPQGRVRQRTLGSKERQILPGPQGTQAHPVPPGLRRRFCLTDAELKQLAALGRQVTTHYGAPQDTEWAIAGGRVYLLQSRPITVTALGYAGPKLSRFELLSQAASADNNMDHWPEPLTPLDAAIYRVATQGLGRMLALLGAAVPPDRRYYEELSDGRVAIRPLSVTPRLPMLWRVPRRTLKDLRDDPGAAWPALRAELLRVLEPLEQADAAGMSDPDLASGIGAALAALEREFQDRFQSMFTSGMLHEALARLWARLALGRKAGAWAAHGLFLALPYRTAEMNRGAARLAQTAAEHGRQSPEFRRSLDAFLAEWGCRPSRGMEGVPSVPTWQEDPSAVFGLMDALQSDPAALDADAQIRRQAEQFAAACEQVAARLPGPCRRWFLHSVAMARRYIVAREDSLLVHERASALIRRLALELGRRLREAGRTAGVDDVFFLFETEIPAAARGELDLRDRITRRRRAYEQVLAAHRRGENWFIASGSLPPEAIPRRTPAGGALLKGVPASRGRVSGPVCIVRDQSEFGKLKKGDILVAPLTAPAWTPLFSVAAAVVTDVGGPLSHAAIVAREYAIPAVLGTGKATSLLKDGQTVTVDGSTGMVTR